MTTNNTRDEIQDDDEPLIMTLAYDDGTEMEVEVMGVFEADGKEYIAVLPNDGTDDVYIYSYSEDENGDPNPTDIEDDEELKKVVEVFESIMGSEEDEE